MKVLTRHVFVNDEGEKFFGEGPYQLLKKVEETGSLHAASADLGMAYSKATLLLKNAEKSLGYALTVRRIGGKSGGGSVLTGEAKEFLARYEAYRNACLVHNEKMYEMYFGQKEISTLRVGCVIMASGLGKRFGGDKLMAELCGQPLIQYVLEATDGVFVDRVVVTRNDAVKAWCEDRQVPVVYHSLSGRNDAVRLGLETLENRAGESYLDGCVFCPGDMPLMSRESLLTMISSARELKTHIFRMAYQGQVGAPVLFGCSFFDGLKALPAGKGGNELIRQNPGKLCVIEAREECELWDVDTKEDFEKVKEHMRRQL